MSNILFLVRKILKYVAIVCSIQCLFFFSLFSGNDPHTSHFYIGFWILAGLCGFLTLEKLFGEDKGENSSVKKEKLAKEQVNTCFVE